MTSLTQRTLSTVALAAFLTASGAAAAELSKPESLALEANKRSPAAVSPAARSSELEINVRTSRNSSVFYESESNNQPSSANLIPAGALIAVGSISPSGDVDYFAVSVPSGSRGFLSIDGTDGTLANGDSTLELRAADGLTVLESDDDSGPINLSSGIAGVRLTAGGQYYLRVAALGSSLDPYLLLLSFEPDSPVGEAEPNDSSSGANVLDGLIAGALGAGDSDWFAFPALVGDLVLLALDPDPQRIGSSLDAMLEIYDPTGNLLRAQDLNGRGEPEFINLALAPADGIYRARLSSADGSSGSYLVSIRAHRFQVPVELLDFLATPG